MVTSIRPCFGFMRRITVSAFMSVNTEIWGAWPDNWSLWQRALDDAAFKHNHTGPREFVQSVRLESL